MGRPFEAVQTVEESFRADPFKRLGRGGVIGETVVEEVPLIAAWQNLSSQTV
jgi:hypothetical protein